ncbi:MAG: arylsulfatase [Marinilabiliaceae bacterium]|nr:arylsulfatase [Marinilabiliaceae bacterium]
MRLLFIAAIAGLLFSCNKKEELLNKPNIIFILADDLGYGDISCNGQSNFQTPNIDRLASQGVTFTNHYSGSTVCAPSRSTLLTGLHTGHTPIRGNVGVKPEGQFPLPDTILTLPKLLKQSGYVTGVFGKWGLGYPGSTGDPQNQGFDEFFGYNCQTLAHNYYPYFLRHNGDKIILSENKGNKEGIYSADMIHQKALEFVRANKDTSFFMFMSSALPHAELVVPERQMKKFRGKFLPEKRYDGVDSGPKFRQGPYGSQTESHAAFAGMVDLLDQQVGEIIELVKELGIEKNTLIIFSSDNGPHKEGGADPDYFNSNGSYSGYKRDLFEGGIRVPYFACWAGKIEPGSKNNHVSAFWDLLPTLTELVSTDKPENIDGLSYLPSLLNKGEQKKHDFLYWEFYENNGRVAVLKDNWKYIKYNTSLDTPDVMLFDISKDIGELTNVAEQYPDIVKELDSLATLSHIPSPDFFIKKESVKE